MSPSSHLLMILVTVAPWRRLLLTHPVPLHRQIERSVEVRHLGAVVAKEEGREWGDEALQRLGRERVVPAVHGHDVAAALGELEAAHAVAVELEGELLGLRGWTQSGGTSRDFYACCF